MKTDLDSQCKLILRYMLKGNRITALQALNLFGCFRLAARIHDLKRFGNKVEMMIISVNNKRVAQYYINKDDDARKSN